MDFATLIDLGHKVMANPGKLSVGSLSLQGDINEALALERNSRIGNKRRNDRETQNRADASMEQTVAEAQRRPLGVTQDQVDAVKGLGPERKDFKSFAAMAPDLAAKEVNQWAAAYGAERARDAEGQTAAADQFYKGVGAAGEPYYTNIASPGDRQAGVHDLQAFTPPGGSISAGGPGESTDPRMREVVQRVRQAREEIAYGPKSEDVIAQEVSKHMPSATRDLQTMGDEAASAKWLGMVEKGQLSDSAYKRLHAETADVAKRKDESDFAKTRQEYVDLAREVGVTKALDVMNESRMIGKGTNPSHLHRIEAELQAKGRTETDAEAIQSPEAFLPLTGVDASRWRDLSGTPPGTKTDKSAPPTIMNPHSGHTTMGNASKNVDATVASLIGSVTQEDKTGSAARDASTYSALGYNPTREGSTIEPARQIPGGQAQNVGGADLGYQMNAPFFPEGRDSGLPSLEDMNAWLIGGGDKERGRRNLALRKARKEARL
jgi:hypothetical protein